VKKRKKRKKLAAVVIPRDGLVFEGGAYVCLTSVRSLTTYGRWAESWSLWLQQVWSSVMNLIIFHSVQSCMERKVVVRSRYSFVSLGLTSMSQLTNLFVSYPSLTSTSASYRTPFESPLSLSAAVVTFFFLFLFLHRMITTLFLLQLPQQYHIYQSKYHLQYHVKSLSINVRGRL
jgi:hypothetical protein